MSAIQRQDAVFCVISGAGMSSASGIPTFRDKDGLWQNYSPSDLATPRAFARDPVLVWEWYRWRIKTVLNARPNMAHRTLASIEDNGLKISILTQNVDDLHERAGSSDVIHLHGRILDARCTSCENRFNWNSDLLERLVTVPVCENCGDNFRPDVIWFGESLDGEVLESCIDKLGQIDILLVIGTSGVVYPAAAFPQLAKQMNPRVEIIEFNTAHTPISSIADRTIIGPVEQTLNRYLSKEGCKS